MTLHSHPPGSSHASKANPRPGEARSLAQSAADLATAAMSTGSPPEPAALAKARDDLAAALAAAPDDLGVLFLAFQFHFRLGELDPAEQHVRRRLELAAPESADAARAYTNLGILTQTRGDLDRAEEYLTRAVEIDRRLGNAEGLARDLGNLGCIPEARGDLARAEALYNEAIEIAQTIPGPRGEEMVASNLSNLGDIAKTRGRLDVARDLWTRSWETYQRLGIAKWKAVFEKRFAELRDFPG